MSRFPALLAVVALAGCVHSNRYVGPHGETMVDVSCNGCLLSMGDCMSRARNECGGDFDVVNQGQATNYVANWNAYGGNVTPVTSRGLVAVCRESARPGPATGDPVGADRTYDSSATRVVHRGVCAQRSGTFVTTMKEQPGGTCGPLPEQKLTIESQPTEPPAPCKGSITYSDDNCKVTFDTQCPMDEHSQNMRQVGEVVWARDASSAEGVIVVTLTSGPGGKNCQSTYDVSSARR